MKTLLIAAAAMFALPLLAVDASAHGCHRSAELGPAGWHRHVGPRCARVALSAPNRGYRYGNRPYSGRAARCVERCNYVGPFKQCRTVCN